MLIKFNDYRRHRNKFIAAACKINKLLTMAKKLNYFNFHLLSRCRRYCDTNFIATADNVPRPY